MSFREEQHEPRKRVFLIVMDSVGIGEMPDASDFGDVGSNTLGNIAGALPLGLSLPTLQGLGLGNIAPIKGVPPADAPRACFGKAAERSPAKDTTLGHWEIAGYVADRPFPVYPEGFPKELVADFCRACELPEVLCNRPASGTEIIRALGDEHCRTGLPILYTSADSVFQVAAHEDVIPVKRLHEMCAIARRLLTGEHRVGRVIARPFIGTSGEYKRTINRKDFSVEPPEPTLLDHVKRAGLEVVGVGKIGDIFAHKGTTDEIKTTSNEEGMAATLRIAGTMTAGGLVFVNLVDFDMLYGHRNNVEGYAAALEVFDAWLPSLLDAMTASDMLVLTADHGCDPTTPSTDHSREYVPILCVGASLRSGVDLGTRESFADIAATVSEYLELGGFGPGSSFLDALVA